MDTALDGRRCRSFFTGAGAASGESPDVVSPARPPGLIGWVDAVLYPAALWLCFVGMAVANDIDVGPEVQSTGGTELDSQVAVKLALAALGLALGCWALWFRRDLRRLLTSLPGMLIAALAIWHFASAPFAVSPLKAIVTALTFVAVAGVACGMLIEFGFRRVAIAALIGSTLYAIGSIALFAAAPELAMFQEVLNSMVTVERFGGLSHPNVTAKYAVLMGLIAAGGVAERYISWRWLVPALVLSAMILVATKSRTPMLAGTAAIAAMALPLLRFRGTYLAIAIAAAAGLMTYIAIEATVGTDSLQEELLRSGTKTGSIEELATFTGRTEIWAYSLERTAERPVFGWGMGSTAEVMKEHSGHSHNILLHPLLGFGIPGGLLVLALLLLNIAAAITSRDAVVRGIVVFTLVLGLAESPLLRPFPDSLTMLWLAIAALPVARAIRS